MKRLALFLALLPLAGCTPNQQKQAAQAVDDAASALLAAQQVETAAHNGGLISASADLFIQTQFNRSASSARPPIAAWAGRPVPAPRLPA